jgi:hypothetical protein
MSSPVDQFAGSCADNHLPEGNSCDPAAETPRFETQQAQYGPLLAPYNPRARMTAMRRLRALVPDLASLPVALLTDQKCHRCALATRKSRNTCTRATDFSSSG